MRFIELNKCGHAFHYSLSNGGVKVGESDDALVQEYKLMMERLVQFCGVKCENNCKKRCNTEEHDKIDCKRPKCERCVIVKKWQAQNLKAEPVISLKTEKTDVDGKFVLTEEAEMLIEEHFDKFSINDEPLVIIFASCWSKQSPINDILRAHGLYAVLAMKKDRGDITVDKVYKLNEEQIKLLKAVMKEDKNGAIKKDVIIAGTYS